MGSACLVAGHLALLGSSYSSIVYRWLSIHRCLCLHSPGQRVHFLHRGKFGFSLHERHTTRRVFVKGRLCPLYTSSKPTVISTSTLSVRSSSPPFSYFFTTSI